MLSVRFKCVWIFLKPCITCMDIVLINAVSFMSVMLVCACVTLYEWAVITWPYTSELLSHGLIPVGCYHMALYQWVVITWPYTSGLLSHGLTLVDCYHMTLYQWIVTHSLVWIKHMSEVITTYMCFFKW